MEIERMHRKEFLRRLGLSTLVLPLAGACGNDLEPSDNASACNVSPSETAGPFPTKNPSGLILNDIRSDRQGVKMTMQITVQNKNAGCSALEGAMVDVWHCDKDGYYSEYGGTGLQSANLQNVHFLRGRQMTNSDGLASFLTIFPGWYPGRAPHIHVHVFDGRGKSLLVTQIAFPTDVCNEVYNTATSLYTKGIQDTSNNGDGVFRNSLAQQMSAMTGNINDGYTMKHTIIVSA